MPTFTAGQFMCMFLCVVAVIGAVGLAFADAYGSRRAGDISDHDPDDPFDHDGDSRG